MVFLDESGFLLGPLVRRSWSRRGETPVLHQRGRYHPKVSVIGALAVSPLGDRVRFFFRLYRDQAIESVEVVEFLRQLNQGIRAATVLLWDRSSVHRAARTRRFLLHQTNLEPFWLPAYAPELNPMEYGWSYLKMNPLANRPFRETWQLARASHRAAKLLQYRPTLLRSFIEHSPLFLDHS